MRPPAEPVTSLPGPHPGPTNPFTPFRIEEVEQSIPARFEQQARQHPKRIAVCMDRGDLDYQTLNAAANQAARAILAQVGPGEEAVAFLLEPGANQFIALLGILKAGKVFVPLDASLPQGRSAAILEDVQPRLVITDQANQPLARELTVTRCPLLDLQQIQVGEREDPGLLLAPDRPAYMLYTSGTTGKPRGVVHSHRNVLHYVLKYTNHFHISQEDRLSLLTALNFNAGMADVFTALLNGATILPFDVKRAGLAALADWLLQQRITLYHSVPTLFRHFAATLTASATFPHLRLIRLGGEPVSRKDVELYQRLFGPHCLLVVTLGATEIPGIRHYFLDKQTNTGSGRIPVGYAMADTEVLLLDDAGLPVGPNAPGEITVRSAILTVGYWRDPERTQAVFRPDPDRPGVRLYRTGDLGRIRPDGCLEHLGRKDAQVKIRGHRVDVTELEAVLLDLGRLKEAVVVAREDGGEQRLVAYCVPAGKPAPATHALRRALTDRFPAFMVPSAWVMLDALPLTTTGKVDRLALPDPAPGRPALANRYVPPSDPLTFKLVKIWESLLRVVPVGVQDDFFDLGGDSLLAMRMLAEVETVYGKKLSLATLFNRPTIETVASALLQRDGTPPSPLVQVQAGNGGRPFVFLHGDVTGGGLFCVPLARQLGQDQPVYALLPHGGFSDEIPLTIEVMAAEHLDTLCAFQPQGPYLLGGDCNGALVAFEMARRLVARGQKVDLIVMVDAPPILRLAPAPGVPASFGVGQPPPPNWLTADKVQLRGVPAEKRLGVVVMAYRTAFARYRPRFYPGRITMINPGEYIRNSKRADREDKQAEREGKQAERARALHGGAEREDIDISMGWKEFARETEVYLLPGDFHAAVTTHLPFLGEALKVCLQKVRTATG